MIPSMDMPDWAGPARSRNRSGGQGTRAEEPLSLLPLERGKWPSGAAAIRQAAAAEQMGANKPPAPGKNALAFAALALLAAAGIGGHFWLKAKPDSEPIPAAQARGRPRTAVVSASAETELRISAPAATTAAPAARQERSAPVRQPVGAVSIAAKKPTINPALVRGHERLIAGDADGARQAYEKLLRLEPNNADALHGMAAISLRQGQPDAAESYFVRALEANPKDAFALAGLITLKGQADPVPSESRLQNLIAAQPEPAFPHFALGNLYAGQGRWHEARSAYFKALQADPDNPDTLFNVAVSFDHLHQPAAALDYYLRALALAEDHPFGFDKTQLVMRLREPR